MSQKAIPPHEAQTAAAEMQKATELDALISARQAHHYAAAHTDEAVLVDLLVQLAATTTPTPDFMAGLQEQLQQQARQQMTQQMTQQLIDQTARQLPVWQTISQRLRFPWTSRWSFTAHRVAFAALLILVLLLGFFVTPPTVRATLWDWLYGVGLIDETRVAEQLISIETPTLRADAPAALTLSALRQQAPFPVQPPTGLPAALRFTGGFVMPTDAGTQVTLAYHTSPEPTAGYALDAPLLFVAISDDALANRPLVAEGYQQAVKIGKYVGIYTQGNWQSAPAPSATGTQTDTQTAPLFWDSTADVAWLVWQTDHLNYLLYAQGLGFTSEEMAKIAESME